jgi:hypothetical protein
MKCWVDYLDWMLDWREVVLLGSKMAESWDRKTGRAMDG